MGIVGAQLFYSWLSFILIRRIFLKIKSTKRVILSAAIIISISWQYCVHNSIVIIHINYHHHHRKAVDQIPVVSLRLLSVFLLFLDAEASDSLGIGNDNTIIARSESRLLRAGRTISSTMKTGISVLLVGIVAIATGHMCGHASSLLLLSASSSSSSSRIIASSSVMTIADRRGDISVSTRRTTRMRTFAQQSQHRDW